MRLLIAKLATASVQSVSVALNSETDVADIATDLETCVRLLRSGGYDLVLLMVTQSRLRARDAISRLRRENSHVPMVVLTESEATELSAASAQATTGAALGAPAGISAGASGSTAPASREGALIPTLAPTLASSGEEQAAAPWMWDDPPPLGAGIGRATSLASGGPRRVSLDGQSEMLRIDDQPVGLSQAEFRIFARLWEQRGRIVSAEELMTAIYGSGDRPASRVLPVFLFKLRRKLSALGLGDLVETAIGRGFTIRAEAETSVEAANG